MASPLDSMNGSWSSQKVHSNTNLERPINPATQTDYSTMQGVVRPRLQSLVIPHTTDLSPRIEDVIYHLSEQPPSTNITTTTIPIDPPNTTISTPQRTRPQRHAAAKALLSLSTAYEPLVIHAARSERSSSDASVTGHPGNGVSEKSGMLIIDNMLPDIGDSDGDSDGYECAGTRKGKGKRRRAGLKRKRDQITGVGSQRRRTAARKKGEKLDRDDLALIAKAAQEILTGEEGKVVAKKKKSGKRETLLNGLKRNEVERLVRFVEENVDWNLAAVTLSQFEIGRENSGDGTEQDQRPTMKLEKGADDSDAVKCVMVVPEGAPTAVSLKDHWRDILSKRIVDWYLD